MAKNPLNNKSFYDGDGKAFKPIIDNILLLEKSVQSLNKTLKDSKDVLSSVNATTSQGLKTQKDEIDKVAIAEKKLMEAKTAQSKEIAKLNILIADQNKKNKEAAKDEAYLKKVQDGQLGTLTKLKEENKKLKKERESLNLETKEGTKRLSEINKELEKNAKIISKAGTETEKMKESYFKLGDILRKAQVGIGLAAGAIGALGTAFKGYEQVMRSTIGGTEKFEQQMAAAKGAFDGFMISIANGDFANIVSNMRDMANSAERLVEAEQEHKKFAAAVGQSTAQTNKAKAELLRTLRNTNELEVSNEERLKAGNKYLELEIADQNELVSVAKEKQEYFQKEITARVKIGAERRNITEAETRDYLNTIARNRELVKKADIFRKEYESRKKALEIAKIDASMANNAVAIQGAAKRLGIAEKNFMVYENALAVGKSQLNNFIKIDMAVRKQNISVEEMSKIYEDLFVAEAGFAESTQRVYSTLNTVKAEIAAKDAERAKVRMADEKALAEEKLKIETQAWKDLRVNIESVQDLIESSDTTEKLIEANAQIVLTQEQIDANEKQYAINRKQELEERISLTNYHLDTAMNAANMLTRINQVNMDKELAKYEGNEAKQTAIKRKFAKKQQQIDIARAVIGGAQAVISGLQTQPFWPLGVAMGALAAVLAGVEINAISSQKFAKGGHGVVEGNSHNSGGVKIKGVGEVEGGEYFSVFSKKQTKKYEPLISNFTDAINKDKVDSLMMQGSNNINIMPHVFADFTKLVNINKQMVNEQSKTNYYLGKQKQVVGNNKYIDVNGNITKFV